MYLAQTRRKSTASTMQACCWSLSSRKTAECDVRVGTTHIVCSSQRGFKKLAQLMAIISMASALMGRDPSMPLIPTGDMNAKAGSLITELVARAESTNVVTAIEQSWHLNEPKQTIAHRVLRVMLESDPRPRGWKWLVQQQQQGNGSMDAEVVCVQELDKIHFEKEFGRGMARLGYEGRHETRRAALAHGVAVFFRTARINLVQAYSVPCPERVILSGIEHVGLLVVLEVADEGVVRRMCVGTTHIVCNHSQGFRKLGQIMALLSAAKVMMKRDPAMPLRSVDLSSRAESKFFREPTSQTPRAADPEHLKRIRMLHLEVVPFPRRRSGLRLERPRGALHYQVPARPASDHFAIGAGYRFKDQVLKRNCVASGELYSGIFRFSLGYGL
ncbi:hypothetical protein BGZ70_007499 [Mortierella alpina]|uniref:Endonuclease/exonuclease/phosphatase domain-containing protein n=1 Tax=Mortierella alpina TaxID=64518 RepID=A0A9P6JH74_MORAP|nr:hypothetical protein BGZ70_007499 [Mortierella alpina]